MGENTCIEEIKKVLSSIGDVLNNFILFFNSKKSVFETDEINNKNFDLLIYALNCNCSLPIIKFIINNCKNYTISLNYEAHKNKVPLFIAFEKAIPKNIDNNNKKFYFIQQFLEIFNLLVEHGADVNFCNKRGENLFIYLYNKDLLNVEIFKFLFTKKVNFNYQL